MCIDNYRSTEFEEHSIRRYQQAGTFVLIGTTNPYNTYNRLNGGWVYRGTNPRAGTKTPPLGLVRDWRHCDTVSTMVDLKALLGCEAFNKIFAVPDYVNDVSPILNAMDREAFPLLNNQGVNHNGLTHVRHIKSHIIELLEREYSISGNQMDDTYQETLTRFIVDTIQKLVNALSSNM